ncbi:efflux RND transporter periplasmic adaptor subunit [Clostridium sp. MCC353]|nr:efflux RND transporter periplasmic adaptor subunit [Clostridium sp. MCC353]
MRKKPVEQYEVRPTVTIDKPKTGNIVLYTDMVGFVEPETSVSVQPRIGGQVLEVYVQSGEWVEAGQPLIKIDSDDLTTLKLQMDGAAVSVKDTANNAARIRVLFGAGYVSQQEMEQAESAEKSARIAYETAKNQYELQMSYTTVKAPISGIIESRTVEPFEQIDPSRVICVISGTDELQVKFGVTGRILENLSLNDSITIEKNGETYEGYVTEISTMVNASSGLYDVKARLPRTEGLTNGTRIKLTTVMSRAENVLTVPVDIVDYDNGVPFVYCYQDGAASKTEIEAGIYDSERMEVKYGLTGDSRIITSWSNELLDRQEVLLDQEGQSDKRLQEDVLDRQVSRND